MLAEILSFVALINPFALFLYLDPIRKDLPFSKFVGVIFRASVISLAISLIFFFVGDYLLRDIFQIHFESFRIFGGIVIFSAAYLFVIKGSNAIVMMKEDLGDLASEIALPFMVGAGTISLTILMAQNLMVYEGVSVLFIVYGTVFLVLYFMSILRKQIEAKKFRIAFDKHVGVLLRLNGFLLGSIGVDMIVKGIQNIFF